MASKRTLWTKLGKFISGLVIACFFMPFFGVSCDGMDVVTVSGADMVGGCKPGGLIAAAEEGEMQGGSLDAKIEKVDREPLAIVALAVVVLAFGATLMKTRTAVIAALALSLAALGALGGLYVKVKGDMGEMVDKELQSKSAGRMTADAKVDAGGRLGLWGAGLGLLALAALSGLALREKEPDGQG